MPDAATVFDNTVIEILASKDQLIADIERSHEAFMNQCRLDWQAYLELLPRLEALEAVYGITPQQSLPLRK